MAALAVGYFLCYIPFATLTRALSTGLVPGLDQDVGGLVLLPAAAIGVLAGMAGFLFLMGWWRSIGLRRIGGRRRRFPRPAMIAALPGAESACRAKRRAGVETCRIAQPRAGDWFVALSSREAATEFELLANAGRAGRR